MDTECAGCKEKTEAIRGLLAVRDDLTTQIIQLHNKFISRFKEAKKRACEGIGEDFYQGIPTSGLGRMPEKPSESCFDAED